VNNILISVVDRSTSGSYHVKLYIDEKESGIFYLSPDQLHSLVKILRNGCSTYDTTFVLENPYDENFSEEEENNFNQETE
jgi:hypothetical protein